MSENTDKLNGKTQALKRAMEQPRDRSCFPSSPGYIILEWKDGKTWKAFQKLNRGGCREDALTVGYLENLGRRILKDNKWRVRKI